MESNTEQLIKNTELDRLVDEVILGGVPGRKDLIHWIKEQPVTDRKRLLKRYVTHLSIKDVPDRSLLIKMSGIGDPEARAKALVTYLNTLSIEQAKITRDGAKKIPGFFNKEGGRFNNEYGRLIKKRNEEIGKKESEPRSGFGDLIRLFRPEQKELTP